MPFDKHLVHKSFKKKDELVAPLDRLSFLPDYHGIDGNATIAVFLEDGKNTSTYHVPLGQIGVTLSSDESRETRVRITGIETEVIKYAQQVTILVPSFYQDDVMVWVKYLSKLKQEYNDWLANRPTPRRVLPPGSSSK